MIDDTHDTTGAAQEDDYDGELAEHVDATVERLADVIAVDDAETMATPFGSMTEADLLGMVRPMLYQWVASHREKALDSIALIHAATGDLLAEHAPDEDVDELAERALDGGES